MYVNKNKIFDGSSKLMKMGKLFFDSRMAYARVFHLRLSNNIRLFEYIGARRQPYWTF